MAVTRATGATATRGVQTRHNKRIRRVGFYGCTVLNRLVRVGLAGNIPAKTKQYPKHVIASCPCGERHDVHVMWRVLNKGETLDAEVFVNHEDLLPDTRPPEDAEEGEEDLS